MQESVRIMKSLDNTNVLTINTHRLVAPFLPKFSSKNSGVTYLLDIPIKLALTFQ